MSIEMNIQQVPGPAPATIRAPAAPRPTPPGAVSEKKSPPVLLPVEERHLRSYDREAAVYDRKRFASRGGRLTAELQERTIVDLLAPTPGEAILDVAAGTGRITETLVRSGAQVTAVDLSEVMLSTLARRLDEQALPPVRRIRANARMLPFADGSFDKVVSIRFLHLIPHRYQKLFVDELFRVTKPGGLVLVEFVNAFFGGPLGVVYHLLTRAWRGERMAGSLLPHRERRLFRGRRVLARAGSIYPGAGRIARRSRPLALRLRRAWYRFPLNHLTLTFMVLCRR